MTSPEKPKSDKLPDAEAIYAMPEARVEVGDTVSARGMFYMRVFQVGVTGAALVTEAVWRRWQQGVPPTLREITVLPLTEIEATGPTAHFRSHVGWSVGG